MMYITKIKLSNVRCYEEATINFDEAGTSILICGNNGSGKTALLRGIAMGLCDQASSGALLRDLPGDFIRKTSDRQESREAIINVEMGEPSVGDQRYSIETKFNTRSDAIFETVETVTYPQDFPWNSIFVAGYGAGLRTRGTEDYVQYFAPDAVYSLFEYSYPLQSPELGWRRLIDAAPTAQEKESVKNNVSAVLKKVLGLDNNDHPSMEHNGLFIKSSWGKHELNALGDGYQALVTIILDILSWKLLAKNNKAILDAYEANEEPEWQPILSTEDLDGVVIIDEIEKHLHPKLQHNIIYLLKSVFPNIQFIISTHSPLCVSGTADVEKGLFKIFKTYSDASGTIDLIEMEIPVGLSADEIFERYFEIGDTRNSNLQRELEEYRRLYLKETLIGDESDRLKELETNLQDVIGDTLKDRHEITQERIAKTLDDLIKTIKGRHDQS